LGESATCWNEKQFKQVYYIDFKNN
jgi:hypothetical protein